MSFDYTPDLSDGVVRLERLAPEDFHDLYAVAADPLLWADHPCKNRYEHAEFEHWFSAALATPGVIKFIEVASGRVIGSSRYYDFSRDAGEVAIGYTFLARDLWGGEFNARIKRLMLAHAFQSVGRVWFHIAMTNTRSRKAIAKIGAELVHTEEKSLAGQSELYGCFALHRDQWASLQAESSIAT